MFISIFVMAHAWPVNLLVLGYGCGLGWFSPALPLLLSSDTPLISGSLTVEQLSWSGSIASITSAIGSLIYGYWTVRIGTKRSLLTLFIPQLVICHSFANFCEFCEFSEQKEIVLYLQLSWLLLIFGPIAECIILSRLLTGLVGGGAQTCTALYFAEISDDNIRGKLSTFYSLLRNLGILLGYVLGICFNYIEASMIYIGISILFAISFICVPATPQYLLQIGADDVSVPFNPWKKPHALKIKKGFIFSRIESKKCI